MTGTTIETEEFKITEIGPLPQDWKVEPFDNVRVKAIGRIPPSIPVTGYQTQGKYPIIDQSANYIAGYTDDDSRVLREQLPVIIFGDHTRIFKFVNFPFAIGADGTKIIYPNSDAYNPKFLYYYFLKLDIPSRGYNRHFRILREQKIAHPPLPEQKRIAYFLSTVQTAIEKTEAVIRATRELKKSLMKHLFTYGPVSIDEAENVTLRETEIGLVPEDWEVVRLEKVCELRKEAVEPTNKGLRYIGLEHMDSGETRVNRFGSEDEVRSTKNRFYKGDILYGKLRPYLDKVAIMNFDGICSTDIIVITTSLNRVSADYLVNLLHLPSFLSFATSTMTGVNHPRTSWKALTPFMIPLPSIVTQKRIAETLFTIDQKIEAGKNQKRALEALFKTLLSSLMTGKIRVNSLEVPV